MGRRGPAPKPVELKIIEGNPGKRALNHNRPTPKPGAPSCPDWLDPEAKREWRRLARELDRLQLLTGADQSVYAGYCQNLARVREAELLLTKEGLTVSLWGTDNEGVAHLVGMRAHPAVAIARGCWLNVLRFGQQLGLSPSSRSGLTIPKPPEDDTLGGLLE